MTAPPDGRRLHRSLAAATAGLLLAALWVGHAAAAAPPVTWSRYRAAAQSVLAEASAQALRLPAGSPLRSGSVRFPDGRTLKVDSALVVAGLADRPGTPAGRAARTALAEVAAAPARPSQLPSAQVAERRLGVILRTPAFASLRPGPLWPLQRRIAAIWRGLGAALGRWGALPPAGMRLAWVLAGLAAAAGGVLGLLRLARTGIERDERSGVRRTARPVRGARGPALPEAERHLQSGDVAMATRLIYAAALRSVEARRGIAIRPGWTAREIRRAGGLDVAWPAFADLAALHERVLFGPPAGGAGNEAAAAAARGWIEEVRRWAPGAAG